MKSQYSEWEDDVTFNLEVLLNIDRSDAQAVVEVNEFYLSQAWGKDLPPADAAQYILDKTKQDGPVSKN